MVDFYKWVEIKNKVFFITPLKIVDNYLGLAGMDGNFEIQGTLHHPNELENIKILSKTPYIENREVLRDFIKYIFKYI